MKDLSTKQLTDELIKREGIFNLRVEPYKKVTITADDIEKEIEGPAIIVINRD